MIKRTNPKDHPLLTYHISNVARYPSLDIINPKSPYLVYCVPSRWSFINKRTGSGKQETDCKIDGQSVITPTTLKTGFRAVWLIKSDPAKHSYFREAWLMPATGSGWAWIRLPGCDKGVMDDSSIQPSYITGPLISLQFTPSFLYHCASSDINTGEDFTRFSWKETLGHVILGAVCNGVILNHWF